MKLLRLHALLFILFSLSLLIATSYTGVYATSTTDMIGGTTSASGTSGNYLIPIFNAITASQSGSLLSIGINLDDGSGHAIVAMYSTYNSGTGKFSGLLGQSASTAVAAGWNDVPITGVTIVSGTTYYLAFINDAGGMDVFYNPSGTFYQAQSYPGTYGAFTDPSVAVNPESGTFNMRMTYTSGTTTTATTSSTTGSSVTIVWTTSGMGGDCDQSATILTVNGVTTTQSQLPYSASFTVGAQFTVTAASSVKTGCSGKRYAFSSWTNGDGLSSNTGTYTVPSSGTTVTANYIVKYGGQ